MIALATVGPLLALIVVVLASLAIADVGGAELRAGVARIDITPPIAERPIPLNGYGERKRKPATGIHDPLYAKAVVFDDGSRRVAVASADLLWIGGELRARVAERLTADGLAPDNVLLFATHNHSGPAGLDRNPVYQYAFGDFDEALFEDMAARLAAVIDEASRHLRPARLSAAATEVPGLVANRRGDGAVDASLTVVKVGDTDGKPMALLVNYGAHPTILGPDNLLVSGEYPGALQAVVEERLGSGAMVLFSTGSGADQMPECNGQGDAFARAREYAQTLGDAVCLLVDGMDGGSACRVGIHTTRVDLPHPRVPENWRNVATDQFMKTLFPAESTVVTLVRLGDAVLVGVPGEIVASLGLRIKQRAAQLGIRFPVVVGLANDYVGYMLTREQYLSGGYESHTASLYGEAFGELMHRRAGDAIDALLHGPVVA